MSEGTLRKLIPGIAVLVALIAVVATIDNAMAARALEPGFTGTFLYRNDNFRTVSKTLAKTVHPVGRHAVEIRAVVSLTQLTVRRMRSRSTCQEYRFPIRNAQ